MRSLRRATTLSFALVAALATLAAPAWAAEPAEVAADIRDDGVFVEAGSDLSSSAAGDLVATVRNEGERFSIVVLTDDPGSGAVTFGDAVVDRLADAGLILVVTPDDVAVVGSGNVYTVDEIDDALNTAVELGGSDRELASNFVAALTGATVVGDSSSGGGGSGLFVLVLVVIAGGLVVFWLMRRSRRGADAATENELAAARAEIQGQIDAVANDLLDIEDEVRLADNTEVDELYNAAGETYREASEALASADTPQELLAIANDLDVAIWQLDSAEALLDGKAPPPRPEPKTLEPAAPRHPSGESGRGPLGLPPRPDYSSGGYSRRPTRRSRGMSPSLLEMLVSLGAGALARRSRRPSLFPSRSTSHRPSPGSGGGFLPSPSRRRSSPSQSSRSSRGSRSSSRRGTGGRIRTGRKRRR